MSLKLTGCFYSTITHLCVQKSTGNLVSQFMTPLNLKLKQHKIKIVNGVQCCLQSQVSLQKHEHISKVSFVLPQRKVSHTCCNNIRVNKWWQNVHFWVNYPFKSQNQSCTIWQAWSNIHYDISRALMLATLLERLRTVSLECHTGKWQIQCTATSPHATEGHMLSLLHHKTGKMIDKHSRMLPAVYCAPCSTVRVICIHIM